MTNADWVRGLPNDKLAEFIYGIKYENKKKCTESSKQLYQYLLEWLEKEHDKHEID